MRPWRGPDFSTMTKQHKRSERLVLHGTGRASRSGTVPSLRVVQFLPSTHVFTGDSGHAVRESRNASGHSWRRDKATCFAVSRLLKAFAALEELTLAALLEVYHEEGC